jgi:Bacterial Ig domain
MSIAQRAPCLVIGPHSADRRIKEVTNITNTRTLKLKITTLISALGACALTALTARATLTLSNANLELRVVNQPVSINSADLLANDITDQAESDGITIVAVGGAAYGVVTLNGGAITYTPNSSFPGQDNFWYTATDGVDTQTASVSIDNPFFAGAGAYGAPIADESYSPQTHQSSGYIRLNVDRAGTFTSKIVVAGYTYSIKGQLAFNTPYVTELRGPGRPTVELQLNAPQGLVGEFSGQASYTLDNVAYFGSFFTGPNFLQLFDSDLVGVYTAAFQYSQPSPNIPNGNPQVGYSGYTNIRITARGQAVMVGKLADGTAFSSSTFVEDGEFVPNSDGLDEFIPVYSPISFGKGSVVGSIEVSTSENGFNIPSTKYHLLQGSANWFLRDATQAGLVNATPMDVIGSTFIAPRRGQTFFETSPNNGAISFTATGGSSNETLYAPGLLGAYPLSGNFTASFSASEFAPNLSIHPSNGTFSGSFVDPATNAKASFNGVVLTMPFFGDASFGVGIFKSQNDIGQVAIQAFGGG